MSDSLIPVRISERSELVFTPLSTYVIPNSSAKWFGNQMNQILFRNPSNLIKIKTITKQC